ncbi:MAG TPA: beta-glucosidase BglX [Verrucomicrobiae bacterium]|jgi:beta-glucosidase
MKYFLKFVTFHATFPPVKRYWVLIGLFAGLAAAAAVPPSIYHDGWIDLNKDGKKEVYEDPSQPIPKRVNDLLKRMTLEEKIGQLWQTDTQTNSDVVMRDRLARGDISSFLCGSHLVEDPLMRNKLQHIDLEQSRLGIPLIFGHDVIHGFRTIFPIPLAEACAWEPDLFERTDTIAAREAAAAGIDWAFSPMLDTARDPRWGRIAEGFGEDPWLGSLYAAACVRGLQGTNVADTNRVVACLKHYVGYGATEGGRDYNTTEISEFTLRNFYLPQFKAGVDAGALTVMSAFNDLDGIPASGNHHTLTDILRTEWRFKGFVVSDYNSVGELIDHGLAADETQAARFGLTAGVDMEMVSTTYQDTVAAQIKSGQISKTVLDEAVRRVLTVKFEKGLFDQPYTDESRWQTANLQPDAVALAREAAAKSCVLLKNDNAILPLSKQITHIALIGPLGDDAEEMVGPWYSRGHLADMVSLASGMKTKLPSNVALAVSRGCSIIEAGKARLHVETYTKITEQPTGSNEIADAVSAANAADVVVMALGEPRDWSGEDGSRSTLDLPGRQQELLDAVAATGKPIVVVLFNGRPLALPAVLDKASAVLEAWFPGVQGGNAVADILFGDTAPSGRLTTTFPYSVGQVPMYYNHYNTGRPGFGFWKGNYVDGPTVPFLPFGFGLTYTSFGYSAVQLASPVLKTGDTLTASVTVTNTGNRAGTEVAQLYIRAMAFAGGTPPVRQLKGFQKISLQPGESRDLTFNIPSRELGFYDTRGNWVVQPGQFEVWICKDSASGDPADFKLE